MPLLSLFSFLLIRLLLIQTASGQRSAQKAQSSRPLSRPDQPYNCPKFDVFSPPDMSCRLRLMPFAMEGSSNALRRCYSSNHIIVQGVKSVRAAVGFHMGSQLLCLAGSRHP
ncbi:hypothetical protein PoB_007700400 [Plakobranchus ocellatus]|uniref:Secreted protein n=1 Tax=Plakobranchus ocellatus TaxID=259542 RepID=A0AAV4E204_9GAST|nr:hypothetical protein PoB_007700400 [Plakobranchus ocellatus]